MRFHKPMMSRGVLIANAAEDIGIPESQKPFFGGCRGTDRGTV